MKEGLKRGKLKFRFLESTQTEEYKYCSWIIWRPHIFYTTQIYFYFKSLKILKKSFLKIIRRKVLFCVYLYSRGLKMEDEVNYSNYLIVGCALSVLLWKLNTLRCNFPKTAKWPPTCPNFQFIGLLWQTFFSRFWEFLRASVQAKNIGNIMDLWWIALAISQPNKCCGWVSSSGLVKLHSRFIEKNSWALGKASNFLFTMQ